MSRPPHHRTILKNQTREVIGRVYDFMKKEAVANYVEKLSDARWRTAQAAGVSESTVTRILRERRALAKESEEKNTERGTPQNDTVSVSTEVEQIFIATCLEVVEDKKNIKIKNEAASLTSEPEDIGTPPKKKIKLEASTESSDSE